MKVAIKTALREEMIQRLSNFFEGEGDEVIIINNTSFSVPVVTTDGEESFLEINIKVPTGPKDGSGYNPYNLREAFLAEKAIQAEKAKVAKEKKDKAIAEKKAKAETKVKKESPVQEEPEDDDDVIYDDQFSDGTSELD